MDLNYRTISRIMGTLFLIIGFALLLPFAVGLIYNEYDSSTAFLSVAMPCILIGVFIVAFIKPGPRQLKRRDGFLIASLSWLFMSLLGALPFVLQGAIPSYIDAFFETCSGFSTTGASILTDIESLPKSMLFWRSFTHWIGGMGILVFAVALLPALGVSGQTIVKSEAPGPVLSKVTPKISDTAKALYIIYIGFSALETILLMFGGMDFYDAVTNAFSTMGTGGFSTYNNSIAAFDSAYVDGVITVFMVLAGVNFNLYFLAVTTRFKAFLKNTEFKLYILIFAAATSLITICLFASGTYESLGESFRYASFQTASILTTTGYATADYCLWPTFAIMLLFLLFFIGGSSSSTGGGIKVVRVAVLLKMIKRSIAVKLHPHALVRIKLDNKVLQHDTLQEICSFAFLYITLVFAVGLIVSLNGSDIATSFSAAASCIGNIGPGMNAIGPTMNYSIFSSPVKIVLSLSMIAGRLELFTFMMLIAPRFWNPSH